MPAKRRVVAITEFLDAPVWEPLERVVVEDLVLGRFMCMYAAETTAGLRLYAYKHKSTRRYIFLDVDGNAYRYVGDESYEPTDLASALREALQPWSERPDSTAEEAAAIWSAIARVETRR